jgi:Ca2+-binding EF-hand superfamily protein
MGGGVSKRRAAYVKRQVGERVAAAGESAAESAARWAKEDEEAWRQDAAAVVVQALCRTRFALKAAEHRRAVRAYHMQVRLAAWVRKWQQRRRFLWAKSRAVLIQRRVRRGWGGTEGERRPPGHERPWRQRTAQSRWQWWDVQGAEVEEDPEQQFAAGRIAEKLEALWTPGARAGFAMDERDLLKLVREAHQEGVHGFVNPDVVLRRAEAAVKQAEKGVKRAETMLEVASTDAEKAEAKEEMVAASAALQEAKDKMPRFDDEDEDEDEEWNDEVEEEDDDTPAPTPPDEIDVPRELILREEDKAWRVVCYQDLPRLVELVGPVAIECRVLDLDGQREWWKFERTLRQLADTEPGTALRQACLELYWWLYLELPFILRDCPDDFAKQLEARRDYLKLLRTIPRFAPVTRQLTVTGYGTNAELHAVLVELEEILQGTQVRLRQEEEERRKRRSANWMNPPTVMVVRWWRTVRGAAVHLQAAWRQYVATCMVQRMREHRAALWLQSTVRMYNVKRRSAFKRFMVLPHVARTESAVFIQRAYRRKRALERWEFSLQLLIQWRASIRVQAVVRGWAVRTMQRRVTQDIAHRVLRVLKKAGLPPWEIWPGYAKTGLTFDRFLKLAELPGHQLGGEIILDELKEQAAAALARQESVVKARIDARSAHLRRLLNIFASDGWVAVPVAGTLFTRGTELRAELDAGPVLPERKRDDQPEGGSSDIWLTRQVEKKMRTTHPYGTEKDGGKWDPKKPAKDMDMYEEVAWLKRQELAKKEWHRLHQERVDFANNWVGRQIEKRMHGTYQYGLPDDENDCAWHYERDYVLKQPPEGLDLYEHAAWLKKQTLAKAAWGKIQEDAAERRRAEETRLKQMEQNTEEPQPEPEPEPEVKHSRWKKVAGNAVAKGTVSGVMVAAAARAHENSRRLPWGIQAADRYRLATVLRDERPAWAKKKRAQARYQLGLIADRNRVAATQIQAAYRARRRRKQLRHAGEQTENQIRQMFDRIGVGRHVDKFVRFGFGFERIIVMRENQLGEERGEVQEKYAMAAWGMTQSERQRVMKALPVEKAKWERSKKMILMKKSKAQRKYSDLEMKVKAVFDAIDTDRSGEIDKSEFGKLMVALGIGMSAKQLNEAWRWMDKDRGGGLDFDEFFRWWKANRDGAEQRGFIAGGGLSQNAEQSEVSQAKSISAFQAMFNEQNIDGAALTSAVERMREEQRNSRPLPLDDVKAIRGDGHGGGLRWSAGGTRGSNIVMSNASTLAYMSAHGGHLDWENPKDISVPGQKWCPPKRNSERGNPLRPNSANLSEWIGGANETRRQAVAEAKAKEFIPVNPRVKVGRMVRVLWEETARAAVERCSAIETGWTDERAARCGQEGEVRQVDRDGTCRIHFPPRHQLHWQDDGSDEDIKDDEQQQSSEEQEHVGFGYGASVVKLANDAVKAAAAAKKKDKAERALRRRIKRGDAAREEALWFPVDAVEPTPGDYSSDEDDRPDASTAYALVASGGMGMSRVVGYEISGCQRKPQLNGSYDIGRMDHDDENAAPEYRQTTGEHWIVWRKVGYGGGQWFIGEAVGLRAGGQGGAPGGANMAFSLGPKDRPAPRDGWYASKVPTGNGGYVPEDKMVVRALLADDGAVKAVSEVADETVRQNWVEIGAGTRRECVQTLKRLGCLGPKAASRRRPIEDPLTIAAVEDCRNRLRVAGEVAQSFGDADGWAGALNLQAECCAALGKERLVGALKLKARSVLESAAASGAAVGGGSREHQELVPRPATANAMSLPALAGAGGSTALTTATKRRPATAVTGRPSTAPNPTPVETLIPPPPPPSVDLASSARPVTAEGGSRRRGGTGEGSVSSRPRTADGLSFAAAAGTGGGGGGGGKRAALQGAKRRRPRTAQQLQQAYQTLPAAVPTMMW